MPMVKQVSNSDVAGSLQTPGTAQWLLAHTYTGVVWGRAENGRWLLSPNNLQTETVLQLRLFSENGETFFWRDESGWWQRTIDDSQGLGDYQDETQILWGTARQSLGNGFTRLSDGAQGLVHDFPLPIPEEYFDQNRHLHRPARLFLRHYIAKNGETGLARISHSRLLRVSYEGMKEKENGSQA